MPRGSPAIKIAITVDRATHAEVLRVAAEEKTSVSAWMTTAAKQHLAIREGLHAVAEWEAQHGTFSKQELEQARQRLFPVPNKKPPKRTR